MKKTRLDRKAEEIQHLDEATQAILHKLNKSDIRLQISAFVLLFIVVTSGVAGIFYQNHYALQNKRHIDCIIKDLATPQKPGTTHKYITDLQTECNIKFTP